MFLFSSCPSRVQFMTVSPTYTVYVKKKQQSFYLYIARSLEHRTTSLCGAAPDISLLCICCCTCTREKNVFKNFLSIIKHEAKDRGRWVRTAMHTGNHIFVPYMRTLLCGEWISHI